MNKGTSSRSSLVEKGTVLPHLNEMRAASRWKSGKFLIATRNGPKEKSGWVRGLFGVHEDITQWVVTHLPSGFACVYARDSKTARKAADEYSRLRGWESIRVDGTPYSWIGSQKLRTQASNLTKRLIAELGVWRG